MGDHSRQEQRARAIFDAVEHHRGQPLPEWTPPLCRYCANPATHEINGRAGVTFVCREHVATAKL